MAVAAQVNGQDGNPEARDSSAHPKVGLLVHHGEAGARAGCPGVAGSPGSVADEQAAYPDRVLVIGRGVELDLPTVYHFPRTESSTRQIRDKEGRRQ